MPKYIALTDVLIAHESRVVKKDVEFTTTFPKGMKLGRNIAPVPEEPPARKKRKADD